MDVDPMTRSDSTVTTPHEFSEVDDLDHGRRRQHTLLWVGGLGVLLVVTMPLAVGLGPVGIPPGTVTQMVTYHLLGWPDSVTWTGAEDSSVWLVRMPRVLLGAVVGAGLALAGVALQAMVRNVLADPYLLGLTYGASTGAALTILFGVGAAVGASSLSGNAFVGAMLASAALYLLARVGGQITYLVVSYAGLDTPAADLEAAGIDSIVPSWRCDQAADFDGIFRTLETLRAHLRYRGRRHENCC